MILLPVGGDILVRNGQRQTGKLCLKLSGHSVIRVTFGCRCYHLALNGWLKGRWRKRLAADNDNGTREHEHSETQHAPDFVPAIVRFLHGAVIWRAFPQGDTVG